MRLLTALFFLIPCATLADEPLRVEFIPVSPAALVSEAGLTGTVEAVNSVDLGFRLGGRVTEVLVQEGDHVTRGDDLAYTDPLQQDQALRVAQASLASASASREQAQQAFDRAAAMLSRGVGTRAARDRAQQALSQAQGAQRRAENAVDQARRALADTVLRAPTDAVVTARMVDPGQIVGAAQPVLSLAGLDGLEAVFQAPDAPELQDAMGTEVTLTSIDIDAPDMTAHVTEISPLVDPNTGSVTVRARIENAPKDTDLLGAAVRGTVHFKAGEGIAIPWTALSRMGDQPAVWVVGDDNRVTLTPVTIARFFDGLVVLSGGVQAGQNVVGAGSQMLYPGRSVIGTGEAQ